MQADEVKVFDEVIESDLAVRLTSLLNRPIWQFGWKSNISRDRFSFWHTHFAGGNISSLSPCLDEMNALSPDIPIPDLWKAIYSRFLEGHQPLRIYGNAHTFGTEGYCHTDSGRDDYFSTIYYAHPAWDANWGGELIFYDSHGDIVSSVSAKPGRIVHFPGRLIHRVAPLTRECDQLRMSIVFKTQLGRGAQ